MKISACSIIKNEEDNLKTYIDGVKTLANEIIVVDTGSTDNSVPLLESLKEKYHLNLTIYNFEWISDFAAAKNFALSKATGDWVIFLDADEYFDKKDRKKIRPLLKKLLPDKKILGISSAFLNVDKDNDFKLLSRGSVVKIFRRGITYTGAVHEHLLCDANKKSFYDSGFDVIHTGYSESISKAKVERNNKIILNHKELAKDSVPEYYGYLAVAYKENGELEKAEEYVRKSVTLMKGKGEYSYIFFWGVYEDIKKAQNLSVAEFEEFIDFALAETERHPDILAEKLSLMLKKDPPDIDEVESVAKEIIEKAKDKKLKKMYLNKTETYLPIAKKILETVYEIRGAK